MVAAVERTGWELRSHTVAGRHRLFLPLCIITGLPHSAGSTVLSTSAVHAHIEQSLVLRLKAGDSVVLYNLGSHKHGAARKAIRAVGVWIIFCHRPTVPIAIQSNRSLPNSRPSYGGSLNDPSRQRANVSAHFSNASQHKNALINSGSQDTHQPHHTVL